jgi:hypothetical protein
VSALLGLRQIAPRLGCRDPRTARRRIRELGVPVLELGGRLLVDEADVERAIRARSRPLGADESAPAAGVALPARARLWNGHGPTTRGGSRP